jgi:hypothetical protein
MKSLWHHKPEDEYVVITNHVISISTTEPQMRGFRIVRACDHECFPTLKEAKSHGFDIQGSDDFNIGAMRNGMLAAILWMDEITDDDPTLMQQVALETELEL